MLQVLDKNSVNNRSHAEDVTEKYLQKPFRDYINDPEFYKSLFKMKILAAPTGFGKTHALTAKDGSLMRCLKWMLRELWYQYPTLESFPEDLEERQFVTWQETAISVKWLIIWMTS